MSAHPLYLPRRPVLPGPLPSRRRQRAPGYCAWFTALAGAFAVLALAFLVAAPVAHPVQAQTPSPTAPDTLQSDTLQSDTLAVDTLALGALAGEAAGRRRASGGAAKGAAWTLVVDGRPAEWPGTPVRAAPESLRTVAARVLRRLQEEGYYYARLDSAVVDTASSAGRDARVRLYAERGPRVVVEAIHLTGAEVIGTGELLRQMDTRAGRPLDPDRLERDLDAMLQLYEDAGYPLAQIRIAETRLHPGSPPTLTVDLTVDEGPKLWLETVTVPDEARSSPALVARLAGLDVGEPLTGYDPEAIRRKLRASDLFAGVGEPSMQVGSDGGAILHVPVEESSPGAFDLVLGYLPPSGTRGGERGGGQIVGSGHLSLENLFGGGRTVDMELDRRPGQVSLFDVAASDPYLFGWPLRVEGRFRGEQRDSTFGTRRYRLGVGYQFDGGLEVQGTGTREVTRPGQAGAALVDGRQQIPRSSALFYGVGLRYRSVDSPRNPRRGGWVEVGLEQGTKQRRFFRRTSEGDTTRVRESLRQERITGTARLYLPVFTRQVVATGVDASALISPSYDRSDLFRIGGAQSLRGYDEDRFLGSTVGRVLLEYRVQIDRVSYAYAFGDLGFVERPPLAGTRDTGPSDTGPSDTDRSLHPGYGIGIQFGTGIGVVNASYALNPDTPSPANGRIHVALSFAL